MLLYSATLLLIRDVARYYAGRGFCYQLQRDFELAFYDYSAAIHINSERHYYFGRRAECLVGMRKFEAALDDYATAAKVAKLAGASSAHHVASYCLECGLLLQQQLKRPAEAAEAFTKSLAADRKAGAHARRGGRVSSTALLKPLQGASAHRAAGAAGVPTRIQCLAARGSCLLALGRAQEALDDLQLVQTEWGQRRDGMYAHVALDLARCLLASGLDERAELAFTAVLQSGSVSERREALCGRGLVRLGAGGRDAEAAADFTEALELTQCQGCDEGPARTARLHLYRARARMRVALTGGGGALPAAAAEAVSPRSSGGGAAAVPTGSARGDGGVYESAAAARKNSAQFTAAGLSAALADAEAAVRLEPTNIEFLHASANILSETGDYRRALEDYMRVLNCAAPDARAAATDDGDSRLTPRTAPRGDGAENTPSNADARARKAECRFGASVCLYKLDRHAEALQLMAGGGDGSSDAAGGSAKAFELRGLVLHDLGHYGRAVEAFSAAIAVDSASQQPYLYRGRSYARMDLHKASRPAVADFTTALVLAGAEHDDADADARPAEAVPAAVERLMAIRGVRRDPAAVYALYHARGVSLFAQGEERAAQGLRDLQVASALGCRDWQLCWHRALCARSLERDAGLLVLSLLCLPATTRREAQSNTMRYRDALGWLQASEAEAARGATGAAATAPQRSALLYHLGVVQGRCAEHAAQNTKAALLQQAEDTMTRALQLLQGADQHSPAARRIGSLGTPMQACPDSDSGLSIIGDDRAHTGVQPRKEGASRSTLQQVRQQQGLWTGACTDFDRVLSHVPTGDDTATLRGWCNRALGRFDAAAADLEGARTIHARPVGPLVDYRNCRTVDEAPEVEVQPYLDPPLLWLE
ncbi:hypothetical protein JKP88DRAFT_323831 [Tribonema minus]|uniref:Uncharacterized protein n=1 Tax=Tribonema minus TaxID=303371 RepID=A0A836CCD9_9STRA|nr:hypothetical protein JKP88DRAFT_323831 [Tribonema minus]